MNNKKIKYQVTTGVILIILGIALLLINIVSEKREKAFSDMNLALSSNITNNDDVINEENNSDEQKHEVQEVVEDRKSEENAYVYEPYIGTLEINKINFYKGFYSKDSSLNNVKFNLYLMPVSSYPDQDKGNVIIAGHSGNYSNSYFRDLYRLEKDDSINIYYNNVKYIYNITNIYKQDKTGTINIYRDTEKSSLTLITCTQNDESHQTVYIAELISKE